MKVLTPFIKIYDEHYEHYIKYDLSGNVICELEKIISWWGYIFNLPHSIDQIPFPALDQAIIAFDQLLIQEGYTILTQEQYNKLKSFI